MKPYELTKLKKRGKKRVGRGLGSGKGKTAGRGTKGQKARGSIPAGFIGGTLPLYRKLPLRRGKGNPVLSNKPKVINVAALNVFKSKTVVDLDELLKQKIISEKDLKYGIKILGEGELENALTIKIPTSMQARKKIEKAGGKIDV